MVSCLSGSAIQSAGVSALYAHDDHQNPGNDYAGVCSSAKSALQVVSKYSLSPAPEPDPPALSEFGYTDMVVVSGTPWLRDKACSNKLWASNHGI